MAVNGARAERTKGAASPLRRRCVAGYDGHMERAGLARPAVLIVLFAGVLAVSAAALFVRLAAAPALSTAAYRLLFASGPALALLPLRGRRELPRLDRGE